MPSSLNQRHWNPEATMPLDGREVIAEEDLVIPVLELSVFGDFMSNLNHPDQPAGSRLQKARQALQFRLDERGAVVHSEAELIGENGVYGGYVPGTRTFGFDKPFLITLRSRRSTSHTLRVGSATRT